MAKQDQLTHKTRVANATLLVGFCCLVVGVNAVVVQEFVPSAFVVPKGLETDRFRLRQLTVADVEKDYEAVVESQELLQALFRGPWPWDGFTLEENLRDLEMHERDFESREGFTFTVVTLDEERVLGAVYIYPSESADAQVHLWIRQSEQENGLDSILFQTVKRWVSEEWPFDRVTYPNREP